MKIGVVRGAFLNPWEGQNFEPLLKNHQLIAFGAKKILAPPGKIPVIHLWSPTDLPDFPKKMPILNRLMIDAHYLLGLEKQLQGFDIAHCAETYYHYTQQCLRARKRGWVKKVVATCWEIIPFNNEGIWGRKSFKQQAFREVDLFITPTKKAKHALIQEGCSPEKIIVVRMGVNLDKFKHQTTNQNPKSLKILFVGRLAEEKGVWDLLEVFRQLLIDLKNFSINLVLIGAGREKKKVLKWINHVSIYQYINTRVVEYWEMPKEYQEADIFVFPSKPITTMEEQYGMALVEAMAAGLPIVTTRCGAIPEVVGQAALLVNPGDQKQLYSALRELIESEERRRVLGLKARQRAEKEFDRDKTASQLEEIYIQLLNG